MDDRRHDDFRAALAFRHTDGLGCSAVRRLLEHYGGLAAAAAAAGEWAELGLVRPAAVDCFRTREWKRDAEAEYQEARRLGWKVLLLGDPEYPRLLRGINAPPVLLYARGDLSLLANPGLAIVGARQASRYGLQTARDIAEALSRRGLTIVSGMALGVDRQAHLGGLAGIGSTIAVMGTGPDRIFPRSNEDLHAAVCRDGLVLTEFPPGTPPEARNFPMRNRVVAGLAHGVFVVEASGKSGALITADMAREQGRTLFALPGRINESTFVGCNRLLTDGAIPVTGAEAILAAMRFELAATLDELPAPAREGLLRLDAAAEVPARHMSPDVPREQIVATGPLLAPLEEKPKRAKAKKTAKPEAAEAPPEPERPALDLSPDEHEVLGVFTDEAPLHIDEVTTRLGRDSGEVSRRLLLLELRGAVKRLPGMYYAAV